MPFTEVDALNAAIVIARTSPCAKSKRGVVIFNSRLGVLATGVNSPPEPFRCDGSEACKAHCNKLCVHAEMAALHQLNVEGLGGLVRLSRETTENPTQLPLDMLHIKVVNGNPVSSDNPSCWQCSREVLAAGVSGFWLLHTGGLRRYPAEEFHECTLRNLSLPVIR